MADAIPNNLVDFASHAHDVVIYLLWCPPSFTRNTGAKRWGRIVEPVRYVHTNSDKRLQPCTLSVVQVYNTLSVVQVNNKNGNST